MIRSSLRKIMTQQQATGTGLSTAKNTHFPKSALDALYSMYQANTASRLKEIENSTTKDSTVPVHQPFIIRLDGVAFHTWTKGLSKPFDYRLAQVFILTTQDLLSQFNPVLGYTQSDEISLVFPAAMPFTSIEQQQEQDETQGQPVQKKPKIQQKQHIYGGRMYKLASVTSSYASARFNYHLMKFNWDDLDLKVREKILGHEAFFDGRVIPMSSDSLISDCIYWRSNCDGLRNSISHIAQHYYKPKELHGLGVSKMLKMLAENQGVDVLRDFPPSLLFGTWIKKEQYEIKNAINPKTGQLVQDPVLRTRVVTGSFNWADYTPEQRTKFTMSKYWGSKEFPPKSAVELATPKKINDSPQ